METKQKVAISNTITIWLSLNFLQLTSYNYNEVKLNYSYWDLQLSDAAYYSWNEGFIMNKIGFVNPN